MRLAVLRLAFNQVSLHRKCAGTIKVLRLAWFLRLSSLRLTMVDCRRLLATAKAPVRWGRRCDTPGLMSIYCCDERFGCCLSA